MLPVKTQPQASVKVQTYRMLREHGIPTGSGDWRDYERGKRLVKEMNLPAGEFVERLGHVADYVGV